jgi:DNA-binding HxlR family transcriptional regulator
MKLEKTTDLPSTLDKRWYDDACGTAMALELVGERWALLVVRELMFGGRRFSELRAGMPGISANILTLRLEGLERVGIVQRRMLPPPASAQLYELTPWGYEADIILQQLGRWAARSPLHDPTLPLSAASIMMSFRTMFSAERSRGEIVQLGFRLGSDTFAIETHTDRIVVTRADPKECAAIVSAVSPMALAAVVYGGQPVAAAEAAGSLTVTGDRYLFARFATWFPLPPKTNVSLAAVQPVPT